MATPADVEREVASIEPNLTEPLRAFPAIDASERRRAAIWVMLWA